MKTLDAWGNESIKCACAFCGKDAVAYLVHIEGRESFINGGADNVKCADCEARIERGNERARACGYWVN